MSPEFGFKKKVQKFDHINATTEEGGMLKIFLEFENYLYIT